MLHISPCHSAKWCLVQHSNLIKCVHTLQIICVVLRVPTYPWGQTSKGGSMNRPGVQLQMLHFKVKQKETNLTRMGGAKLLDGNERGRLQGGQLHWGVPIFEVQNAGCGKSVMVCEWWIPLMFANYETTSRFVGQTRAKQNLRMLSGIGPDRPHALRPHPIRHRWWAVAFAHAARTFSFGARKMGVR